LLIEGRDTSIVIGVEDARAVLIELEECDGTIMELEESAGEIKRLEGVIDLDSTIITSLKYDVESAEELIRQEKIRSVVLQDRLDERDIELHIVKKRVLKVGVGSFIAGILFILILQ